MTTVRRTVHGREVLSFEELVKELGPDAVASPRRSTVPLVDYWRGPEQRLCDFWEQLLGRKPGDTEMHFEHEVPVRRGRGKSSFTDLMVFADDVAVAIEAKFTEPRYESVAAWLGATPTSNRADVLEGWLCAIEAAAETSISRAAVREIPYQLIHRTASVCCVGRRKRLVVYQVFGDSPPDYYSDDLARFAAAIAAPDRIAFVVLGCAFKSTDAFAGLIARWDAGERSLGHDVGAALLAGPLFEFREPVVVPIQPIAGASDQPEASPTASREPQRQKIRRELKP